MQIETGSSSLRTITASHNTTSVREQLLENFKASKSYRHAFVEEKVRTWIAAQIKAIREQREMKRPDFAKMMGKAPSWVFRLEDPNQPPPTISTLLQVAAAFDVDLNITFGRFSELLDRVDRIRPEDLEVPSFDKDTERTETRDQQELTMAATGKLVRLPRSERQSSGYDATQAIRSSAVRTTSLDANSTPTKKQAMQELAGSLEPTIAQSGGTSLNR